MQVERSGPMKNASLLKFGFGLPLSGARVSNTWEICLQVGDNIRKRMLIPHIFLDRLVLERKTALLSLVDDPAAY